MTTSTICLDCGDDNWLLVAAYMCALSEATKTNCARCIYNNINTAYKLYHSIERTEEYYNNIIQVLENTTQCARIIL